MIKIIWNFFLYRFMPIWKINTKNEFHEIFFSLMTQKYLRFLSFNISFSASFFILNILRIFRILLWVINTLITILSLLLVLNISVLINILFLLNHFKIFIYTTFNLNWLFEVLNLLILIHCLLNFLRWKD